MPAAKLEAGYRFDTGLTDLSGNGRTLIAQGSAAVGTSIKKFGAGALSCATFGSYATCDLSGDPIYWPTEAASDPLTIDGWVYPTATGANRIFGIDIDADNYFSIGYENANDARIDYESAGVVESSTSGGFVFTANQFWYFRVEVFFNHITLWAGSSGSEMLAQTLYLDGNIIDLSAGTLVVCGGRRAGNLVASLKHIDDLRILGAPMTYPAPAVTTVPTSEFNADFNGASAPSVPSAPTLALAEDGEGDGSLTFTVVAADPSDTVHLRYKATTSGIWLPGGSISGSGQIVLDSGVTNGTKYEAAAYSANGSYLSVSSNTVTGTPTDGTAPTHDALVDAVAALISAEGYTAIDTDGSSTAFTVSTTWPVKWESVTTPTIFVFPDSVNAMPMPTGLAQYTYGVGILIAEHVHADAQLANRDGTIHSIQALLMDAANTSPIATTWLSPEPFSESKVFDSTDIQALRFITPFSVTYLYRETR